MWGKTGDVERRNSVARRAIERLGLLPGVRLLRRRFDKCHHAKQVLDYQTPRREE